MRYYKILQENKIIGVISSNNFREYQIKYGILIPNFPEKSHFVIFQEQLYHANWMKDVSKFSVDYKLVDIFSINKEEYDILFEAIEVDKEIVFEQVEDLENNYLEEPIIETIEEPTINFIKNSKLKEMSYNCNKTITNGFDITLSDGNSYHFSLTTQDQLNLITLATMVESGETQIPYHADGEPCKFYSTLDIKAIIDKATEFKTYHISYYNSLKIYINSMETMEEISEVTYGIEIPAEYQSEVLKTLL
jgi:hypothetical protein